MSKNLLQGFSLGIIAPLLLLLFYITIILNKNVDTALEVFNKTNTITHHISLSVFFINILIFFLFIKINRDESAKGVIGATFFYTFFIIYLKFL